MPRSPRKGWAKDRRAGQPAGHVRPSGGAHARTRWSGPQAIVSSPWLVNRALGSLYLAGSLCVLVSVVLPHGKSFATVAALTGAGAAAVIGAVTWRARPLTERKIHLLVAVAFAMDIGGTYAGRGATVAVSADVFLVWVALAAASFLPPKGAAAQVGASCAAFAAVLVAIGGPRHRRRRYTSPAPPASPRR